MAADETEFKLWFPRYRALPNGACRLRVVCFAGAGGSQSLFTATVRPGCAPNMLVGLPGVELLACQLPGREERHGQAPMRSAVEVATHVLPLLRGLLATPAQNDGRRPAGGGDVVPWAVLGHSVGTWLAYELVLAAQRAGLPPPVRLLLACFPPPHLPLELRPWRASAGLTDPELQTEARRWNINELVLEPAMWAAFAPLLRADYRLFDEAPVHPIPGTQGSMDLLDCPFTLWFARQDHITEDLVARWGELTAGTSTVQQLEGHHLFVQDAAQKGAWFDAVAAVLLHDAAPAPQ